MYGREARLPVDLTFSTSHVDTLSPAEYAQQLQYILRYAYDLVRSTVGNVQNRQKTLYDRKIHGKPFKKGDLVWVYSTVVPSQSCRKLHHPWTGPYKVLDKLSDVTYKIAPVQNVNKSSVVHFDRLKICPPSIRTPMTSNQPPVVVSPKVGQNAQFMELEEDEMSTSNVEESPNESPVIDHTRYPRHQRQQPNWFHPFIQH